MKKLFIVIFICLTSNLSIIAQSAAEIYARAQEEREEVHEFACERIIECNLPKTTLWINLKKWISSQFKKYKYVVDVEDKDEGVIIIKWTAGPNRTYSLYTAITYGATYQVDVREKKYRIKIFDAFADTSPDNIDILNGLSYKYLKKAENELNLTKTICKKLNYSEKWPLDDHFIEVMNSEEELKSPMSSVKYQFETYNNELLKSLKNAMKYVDDF